MPEIEPSISENDPSSELAHKIANLIEGYIGKEDWLGSESFDVVIANKQKEIAYSYEITKQDASIVIQEAVSNKPLIKKTFHLEKKGSGWTYVDPSLIKYGESSLEELKSVFSRLKLAMEARQIRKKCKKAITK